MRLIRPIAALVWKDLLLELRSRDIVVSALVFGFLVVVVFNFALKVTPQRVAELAPGILWVAFAFAGTLAMSRAFVREREQGGLEGLLLSPVSRDAIFLGKALVSFLFMLVIEAALLPVLAVLLNFTTFSFTLFAAILLATLGFATVGTLFSAIAVQTRSREVMLPVLFLSHNPARAHRRGGSIRRGHRRRAGIRGGNPLAALAGGVRRRFSGNMSLDFFDNR